MTRINNTHKPLKVKLLIFKAIQVNNDNGYNNLAVLAFNISWSFFTCLKSNHLPFNHSLHTSSVLLYAIECCGGSTVYHLTWTRDL